MEEEKTTRNLVLTVCDLSPNGETPSARVSPQMVTIDNKIYLHGGADEEKSYGDIYSMEIGKVHWTELKVHGFSKPTARYGHSLNVWNDKIILFGGLAENPETSAVDAVHSKSNPPVFMPAKSKPWTHVGKLSDEFYILETQNDTWNTPEFSGTAPSPRAFHAATVAKNYFIVYGGCVDTNTMKGTNDLYVLDLNSMMWITAFQKGEVPTPRFGHKIVYYAAKDLIFLFGGADDDGSLFALNVASLDSAASFEDLTWMRISTAGTPPVSRSFHSLDLVGDRLFVFAGATSTEISDLYIYELEKQRWSRPLYEGQINYRAHGSAVMHDKIIIFGGVRERFGDSKGDTAAKRISKRLFFLNVLEIKDNAADNEMKFKLVALGDSGVGKSCLLTRFVQDVYSDFHVATIGVDFKRVVTMVKGRLCTLELWDTAGQERFGGVTGNYYRNAHGFIIVYDATQRSSFEHVDSWIKQIQEYHDCGPGTIKLLIGNKHDLKQNVVVSEEEARVCADRIGAIYVSASAKIAANVDTAFLSAATKLIEIRKRLGNQPKSSSAIDKAMDTLKKDMVEITHPNNDNRNRNGCGCASNKNGKKPAEGQ